MANTEKCMDDRLRSIVGSVQKSFGTESIRVLDGESNRVLDSTSSGCLALDRALGVGGYARGRIVEIFGPESSGKTTLTLHAIAEVQRGGGLAAFVDAEHAFDPAYARATGVRTSELLLSQPDSGEQALDIVESLASSRELALIVIDSVAALVPQAEIDGSLGDNHLGLQARLMSRAMRKLASVASKTATTLIFVNQLRHKIGVTFGSPETTPGGNALKYYASQRLDVRRIGKVSADERVIGNRTRVKVVKNKCAQPFEEAELDIRWGSGIDIMTDLLDTATATGALLRNGAFYVYRGKSIGQGRERARSALLDNTELRAAVLEETLALIWSGAALPACPPTRDDTELEPAALDRADAASAAA
ncbi:MAG TPA: recombinase RecA [Polyangiaceae bacterium]|nr:recombinase RecA [Polyangiaceae bacterium]